jgi:tRNA (cytidine/uridine-2'-O-)-methyltransferase
MDLHIVLVNPEIPQNTGNIARTCAALGATLHLVEPLGFSLEDRYLKRAGLDYWNLLSVLRHQDVAGATEGASSEEVFCVSVRGEVSYTSPEYPERCWLMFGPESTGLDQRILDVNRGRVVRIPMRTEARSLNLSNAVALLAYEVFRQHGFPQLNQFPVASKQGGNG